MARELKCHGKNRDDLFTPASTTGAERVIDMLAAKTGMHTMVLDAKSAYLHAGETELVVATPLNVGWITT